MQDSRCWLIAFVLVGSLWLASPAAAEILYASPTAVKTNPPCPLADPCKLTDAASDAVSGDEVIALAGNYTITTNINLGTGETLRGAAGPRPVITPSAGFIPVLASSNNPAQPTKVSHLKIQGSGGGVSMSGDVIASDLIISTTSVSGVSLLGAGTLRDSLVATSAGFGNAVQVQATNTATAQVRNVTAIATGTDSAGVRVVGSGGPGPCFPVPSDARAAVRNTVARGGVADLAAQGTAAPCPSVGVLDVAHSNFRTTSQATGGTVTEGAGNQKAPAQTDLAAIFVDTVDYRQRATAPTYNAGLAEAGDASFVDPDGHPRVSDGQADIGADELAPAPVLVTAPATGVTQTGGQLEGTVDPQGESTTYRFEYGPTDALGTSGPDQSLPADASPTQVSLPVDGFAPGQTVHYRLSASAGGIQPRTAVSATTSFTTLTPPPPPVAPTVLTQPIGSLTPVSVNLNGSVDPNGQATTWRFVYGPTTAYGSSTATADAGAGDAAVAVSAPVTGLTPGTLFHYRVEGTNPTGTSLGEDATFTTSPLVVANLAVTPRRFRRGVRPPTVAAGGTIRLELNAASKVTLTFLRRQPGRRVGKACKRPTRANRNRKRCTRFVKKGAFSFSAAAGARSVRFFGRIGRRSLPAGRYRLLARATHSTGAKSNTARASFTLLPAR